MLSPSLLSTRTRPVFAIAVFVVAFTFILYAHTRGSSYNFPQGVLQDYTSTAAKCFLSGEKGGVDHSHPSWTKDQQLDIPDVVPVGVIEQYIQAQLSRSHSHVNKTLFKDDFGLKLGRFTLQEYTNYVLGIHEKYFTSSHAQDHWMPLIRSRLSLRPPSSPLPPAPKQVMTTDKSIDHLPEEFGRWKEIMPDWELRYFDDEASKKWITDVMGGTRAQQIWERLPRRVLQTDVFRYMAMLAEGGIYTDSDTAPIIHADDWGRPWTDLTPEYMTHLTRMLAQSTSPHLPPTHPFSTFYDQADDEIGTYQHDGNDVGAPGLIVSIESDALDFGWDNWREIGLARAVQVTQWTFLARPGHPVFLDALGRSLEAAEKIERLTKEAESRGEEYVAESALEWTGPGVFTDCVFRYLLARYGINPDQARLKRPVRIGDVLILPPGSFSSVSPWTDEEQRPYAATWHGFLGRWRQVDPAQAAFEKQREQREKEAAEKEAKEKEDEAEAAKKASIEKWMAENGQSEPPVEFGGK